MSINEDTINAAAWNRTIIDAVTMGKAEPMFALCGLMKLRADEVNQKILVETDPMNMARMQGAARELLRWADYPKELAEKARWLKAEKED